ncbi:hypothetical protein DAMA08_038780 [Martiniozyma asiatica (nom. inval.)]|nr:hypothetical protein DAMA08_038780 [Martiniozyma asiatica]
MGTEQSSNTFTAEEGTENESVPNFNETYQQINRQDISRSFRQYPAYRDVQSNYADQTEMVPSNYSQVSEEVISHQQGFISQSYESVPIYQYNPNAGLSEDINTNIPETQTANFSNDIKNALEIQSQPQIFIRPEISTANNRQNFTSFNDVSTITRQTQTNEPLIPIQQPFLYQTQENKYFNNYSNFHSSQTVKQEYNNSNNNNHNVNVHNTNVHNTNVHNTNFHNNDNNNNNNNKNNNNNNNNNNDDNNNNNNNNDNNNNNNNDNNSNNSNNNNNNTAIYPAPIDLHGSEQPMTQQIIQQPIPVTQQIIQQPLSMTQHQIIQQPLPLPITQQIIQQPMTQQMRRSPNVHILTTQPNIFISPVSETPFHLRQQHDILIENLPLKYQNRETTKNSEDIICPYPDCKYMGTFQTADYLRRHIKEQHIQQSNRSHICGGINEETGVEWGCGKVFKRPYQLVNHWKGRRSLKKCNVPDLILLEHEIVRDLNVLNQKLKRKRRTRKELGKGI